MKTSPWRPLRVSATLLAAVFFLAAATGSAQVVPQPPIVPQAPVHQRTVTLSVGGNGSRLLFSGRLTDVTAGHKSDCVGGVLVVIQRASGSSWVKVASTNAGDSDATGSATFQASVAGGPGTFRADAPVAAPPDATCAEAVSTPVSPEIGPKRCSINDHEGPRGIAEFDLTCARDIIRGSIRIVVNRGGCERGCDAKVKKPQGSDMDCGAFGRQWSGQPSEVLSCEGSLRAGQKLTFLQYLKTRTVPCDIPTFTGTLRVSFGGGVKLGPRRLPSYRCWPHTYRRHFSLFAIGAEPSGGVGWVADLQPNTGYERCVLSVPVLIQANRSGRWVTLVRVRSSNQGSNTGAAQMHGQLPGGSGPGSYRAVAPAIRFGNQSCQETDRTFQQP